MKQISPSSSRLNQIQLSAGFETGIETQARPPVAGRRLHVLLAAFLACATLSGCGVFCGGGGGSGGGFAGGCATGMRF
jgi:hypothetical protein